MSEGIPEDLPDEVVEEVLSKLPEPEIKIENVVSSITIDQRLDLQLIARKLIDVEYQPDQFPGLIYRLDEPKTATLIFSSGKMVCTGAKSKEEALIAVKKIIEQLNEIGMNIRSEPQIKIQNIVASASIHLNIHLKITLFKFERATYEPELHP